MSTQAGKCKCGCGGDTGLLSDYIPGHDLKHTNLLVDKAGGRDNLENLLSYTGPAKGDDVATAIAVDSAGGVYVTGMRLGADGYDYATIKYDGNGDIAWGPILHNGPGNGDLKDDIPTAIAMP